MSHHNQSRCTVAKYRSHFNHIVDGRLIFIVPVNDNYSIGGMYKAARMGQSRQLLLNSGQYI